MRRTAIVSFAPRSPPLAVYSVTLPLGSVSRTQEIAWRLASLRYSTLLAIFMCQWIPAVAWPLSGSPPPVLMSRRTWRGVLASSELKWLNTFSWAPQKFLGQWHCSQVCAAGRRLATGVSMGRGYVLRTVLTTWRVPESFDFTYQLAPEPTWHSTQPTRARAEWPWAIASGCLTEWQSAPQNVVESVNSYAR